MAKLFAEGIEATVPATIRETVVTVGRCVGGGVGEISLTALAKELKLDKNSAHHRVRRAIERGYLVNREEKRGMPARIALADPLPDEIEILPDPGVLECWSDDGGVKEGEDANEGEAKEPFPFIPLDPSSNSPTPPVPGPAPVPSDYDAILEELAAQGRPTNGFLPQRCDHCGQLGATGQYDWPHRPFGIVLHSSCEAPWFDSEGRQ